MAEAIPEQTHGHEPEGPRHVEITSGNTDDLSWCQLRRSIRRGRSHAKRLVMDAQPEKSRVVRAARRPSTVCRERNDPQATLLADRKEEEIVIDPDWTKFTLTKVRRVKNDEDEGETTFTLDGILRLDADAD